MSKAAINQFTRCAALDLAPLGIRVNAINPSAILTPIFGTVGLSSEESAFIVESIRKNYPVGRIGEVSDTSRAIEYLANDSASFSTGVLLPVDGGALLARTALQPDK